MDIVKKTERKIARKRDKVIEPERAEDMIEKQAIIENTLGMYLCIV